MRVKIKSVSWDDLYLEKIGSNLILTIGSSVVSLEKEQIQELFQVLKEKFVD